MAFIQAKCTNCGANLQVDKNLEAAICPYCNSAYIVEKAINHYVTTNNIRANTVNIYGVPSSDFEVISGKLVKYRGSASVVEIPNTVFALGKGAFSDCQYLEKIIIPNSLQRIEHLSFPLMPQKTIEVCVKSLEHWCSIAIEGNLVATCSLRLSVNGIGVSNLVIPTSITSIKANSFAMFNIEKVQLPANCRSIEHGAFEGCMRLTSVQLPSNLTSIAAHAFSRCSSLYSITIPDSVISMGTACFADCKSLRSVILSRNISVIPESAFCGCHALESIDIPSKVASIGFNAFAYCKTLSIVNIANKNQVTIGTQAFMNTPYKEKKGCYIATCVYGSYDCYQVRILRRYRDEQLLAKWYGRRFVQIYYATSPLCVRWFGNIEWIKSLWKHILDVIIAKLEKSGISGLPYQDK